MHQQYIDYRVVHKVVHNRHHNVNKQMISKVSLVSNCIHGCIRSLDRSRGAIGRGRGACGGKYYVIPARQFARPTINLIKAGASIRYWNCH